MPTQEQLSLYPPSAIQALKIAHSLPAADSGKVYAEDAVVQKGPSTKAKATRAPKKQATKVIAKKPKVH